LPRSWSKETSFGKKEGRRKGRESMPKFKKEREEGFVRKPKLKENLDRRLGRNLERRSAPGPGYWKGKTKPNKIRPSKRRGCELTARKDYWEGKPNR